MTDRTSAIYLEALDLLVDIGQYPRACCNAIAKAEGFSRVSDSELCPQFAKAFKPVFSNPMMR